MKTGTNGIAISEHYEGINDGDLTKIGYQPKMDCSDIWTVGIGHALSLNNVFVKGQKDFHLIAEHFPDFSNMSRDECEALFAIDLQEREDTVNRHLTIQVKQCMFDGLVNHVFNCGYSETLFRLVNTMAPVGQLEEWWTKHYIKSDGVILNGLIYRRHTEFTLATTGQLIFYN